MGGLHGNDPFDDLHAYARDLQDAAPDLPPDGIRPVGVRKTRSAAYASRTPHLVAAVAVAFLLVAGGAGTGILADGAVPGDALYSVDLLIEDTWSAVGIPLDTAAERRAESRILAARADSVVALEPTTPDRPAIDTGNVGSDAAEKLTALGAALAPERAPTDRPTSAEDDVPAKNNAPASATRTEPATSPVAEPVVAAPLLEPVEPGSLVVLGTPPAEAPIVLPPSPETTTTTTTPSTTTSSTTTTSTTTTIPVETGTVQPDDDSGATSEGGARKDPETEPDDGATAEPESDAGAEPNTEPGSAEPGAKPESTEPGSPGQGEAAAAGTKGEAAVVGASPAAASPRVRAPEVASRKPDLAAERKAEAAANREARAVAESEAARAERRRTEELKAVTAEARAETRRAEPPAKPDKDEQETTRSTTNRRRKNRRGNEPGNPA